jgi:hypothetical protein
MITAAYQARDLTHDVANTQARTLFISPQIRNGSIVPAARGRLKRSSWQPRAGFLGRELEFIPASHGVNPGLRTDVQSATSTNMRGALGKRASSVNLRLANYSRAFAHVFLFECPQRGRPLASACASPQENLKGADAHWFNPHCHCGGDWGCDWNDRLKALGRTLGEKRSVGAPR